MLVNIKMSYLHILFVLGACLYSSESYKILAVFPVPVRSHYAISSSLLRELANRGHQVTVYTPYLEKTPVKNLKEVSLTSLVDIMEARKKVGIKSETQTFLSISSMYFELSNFLTEHTLKHENIQKLMHSDEKFDLVLMPQHEALFGIAHHFKAPLVLLATMPLYPWINFLLAHPTPPSYVPNLFSAFSSRMNFWERLINSYCDLYIFLRHRLVYLPKHRELAKKYIPGQPNVDDFVTNVSLVLVNSHMSSYDAMPTVPNTIEVGGLHIKEPKKLPEELQKFLDDSVNGVVIFSFGSNLKISALPQGTQNALIKAFSKLKQNVLFKWETDSMPNQPKNIKLMKWIPQSDVMAHPNVKAVVSHGGLLSTMECVYHGVPFIGIPFLGDQKMNMATAETYGYGIQILFNELTEKNLFSALNEVLNNPKYRVNIKKRSNIMHDRPMKPMDSAIYWIEYVIRHQGAPHLRYPGMDLAWYQRNLIDVIAFTLLVAYIIIFIIVFIIKKVFKNLFNSVNKKKRE